jgi:hypothetical protein
MVNNWRSSSRVTGTDFQCALDPPIRGGSTLAPKLSSVARGIVLLLGVMSVVLGQFAERLLTP